MSLKTKCQECGKVMPYFNFPYQVCAACLRKDDNVNQPNHYTQGKYEVIDYIKDKLTNEQYIGYCLGNVLKYVSRHELKGGKEDLGKAQVYLGWAIENYGGDNP